MKYKYLYQTKDNENREGEIDAANREDAYAKIRKLGIRPYRVIGDDPSPWRRRALVAGAATAAVVLGAGLTWGLLALRGPSPLARSAIGVTEAAFEEVAVAGWERLFPEPLDRVLAGYAKPGRLVIMPPPADTNAVVLAEALTRSMGEVRAESETTRQIVRVVRGMRHEFSAFLASGGTPADYFAMLDERQREELSFRSQVEARVAQAPESIRARLWRGANARLAERGIEPLPRPEGLYDMEEEIP